MSHPTWVRGLKLKRAEKNNLPCPVAPYVGAWIETYYLLLLQQHFKVAPYVGAWIETQNCSSACYPQGSHPTWVRGLKPNTSTRKSLLSCVAPYVGAWIETTMRTYQTSCIWSHPTWVRGLKPPKGAFILNTYGRTLRGCVD